MPARSENRPARQANSSGVARRTLLSRIWMRVRNPYLLAFRSRSARKNRPLKRHPHHVVERAREQDHQRLDDDDQLSRDRWSKCQFRAPLIQEPEQDRGEEARQGMAAPHQGHGNADKTCALRTSSGPDVLPRPCTLLIAIIRPSPPEISIAIMVIFVGEIPAYFAQLQNGRKRGFHTQAGCARSEPRPQSRPERQRR